MDVRHIIPISGKDSLCTAIVQRQSNNEIDYEYMFNPTGAELPGVFSWIESVEKYLGASINKIGKPLEEIIKAQNYFLPSRRSRYCTRMSKIKPMLEFIGSDDAVVYFGLRADEERKGFNNMWSPNIECEYPLRDHGLNITDVYRIINKEGLKPPTFFWQRLYDVVNDKFRFEVSEKLEEWVVDMLFAWRSRANCYFCFNQRQYEIVGLWEHYPDLAEKALWYEKQGTVGGYSWREYPFDWYKVNSEKYSIDGLRRSPSL